jgi:L-fucose mutarotase
MKIDRREFLSATGATSAALARGLSCRGQKREMRMLKGISPVISPDLLKVLAEMGHGDEIVFSDAHFPAHTFGREGALVLRADGIPCDALLAGVRALFELDAYATPVVMMAAVPGDTLDPAVEKAYRDALGYDGVIEQMERFAFYERAKKAYAIVLTGEVRKYGNILLKKGVTPTA